MTEAQIVYAIIKGLKPNIRMHVLQQKHDTLSEVKHNARIAEEALRESSADNATVSDLT